MDMLIKIHKEDGGSLSFEKEICKCDNSEWISVVICEKPESYCCIKVKLCDLVCAIEQLGCCHKQECH